MHEILTSRQMGEADRLAIAAGPFDSYRLMRNAGAAVADEILCRFPQSSGVDVLCGPGNNGGDGYVAALVLRERGVAVRVWSAGAPGPGSDAARAQAAWGGEISPLATFAPARDRPVVDALFGAGLARDLDDLHASIARRTAEVGARVTAIDLPSGISGDTGAVMGEAFHAVLTVTFFRLKPGHLLLPGRAHCGETVLADIGISANVLGAIAPATFENGPGLWAAFLPRPAVDTHKYRRGHVAVFSGGIASTGAARLSARAAARAGAGAVTVLSPPAAVIVNAAHLTAIMLRSVSDASDVHAFLADRHPASVVLGPGFGDREKARAFVSLMLEERERAPLLVLDADGITAFEDDPGALFAAAGGKTRVVLTPHEGEFARLFPDLAAARDLSKLDRAGQAAARANAVVILKGADSVIAHADGRAAINANGAPWLATAGSGDVLAGIVAGLAAQGMPLFEAACAAVWLHAEAGATFGPGLLAEDLPEMLPAILGAMFAEAGR